MLGLTLGEALPGGLMPGVFGAGGDGGLPRPLPGGLAPGHRLLVSGGGPLERGRIKLQGPQLVS